MNVLTCCVRMTAIEKILAERHLSVKPFAESVSNEALVSLAKDGHGIAVRAAAPASNT